MRRRAAVPLLDTSICAKKENKSCDVGKVNKASLLFLLLLLKCRRASLKMCILYFQRPRHSHTLKNRNENKVSQKHRKRAPKRGLKNQRKRLRGRMWVKAFQTVNIVMLFPFFCHPEYLMQFTLLSSKSVTHTSSPSDWYMYVVYARETNVGRARDICV